MSLLRTSVTAESSLSDAPLEEQTDLSIMSWLKTSQRCICNLLLMSMYAFFVLAAGPKEVDSNVLAPKHISRTLRTVAATVCALASCAFVVPILVIEMCTNVAWVCSLLLRCRHRRHHSGALVFPRVGRHSPSDRSGTLYQRTPVTAEIVPPEIYERTPLSGATTPPGQSSSSETVDSSETLDNHQTIEMRLVGVFSEEAPAQPAELDPVFDPHDEP